MNSELPIQVDGEPWIQSAGEIVVLKSALKVSKITRYAIGNKILLNIYQLKLSTALNNHITH